MNTQVRGPQLPLTSPLVPRRPANTLSRLNGFRCLHCRHSGNPGLEKAERTAYHVATAGASAQMAPPAPSKSASESPAPMHVRAQLRQGGQAHMTVEPGPRELLITVRLQGLKVVSQCYLHWYVQIPLTPEPFINTLVSKQPPTLTRATVCCRVIHSQAQALSIDRVQYIHNEI